jgi:uncharacterized oxidoreductase
MHLTGNTILVTGGTSGIGRALAENLHRRGNQIIVAGRRQHLLKEVTATHPDMFGRQLDVENPSAIDAFAVKVREEFPRLNVLINNAGISIHTNILGVLHLTAALLPLLRQQPNSTIISTTSGLGFVPRANFPTYCASKAFLHSWLQSLRFQLRETSVEVLELAPPYVQTELGGPHQATDPNAMPLADYVTEVMEVLGEPKPPRGEVLVERVKALRFAENNGQYQRIFAALNG